MGQLLTLDAVSNIGAGALVTLFVLLVLFGRLVPRQTLKDVQKERDTWRSSALTSSIQVERLVSKDDAVLAVLKSIDRQAKHVSEET